jgi:energy-coupling factor transport system ATP-binding protein
MASIVAMDTPVLVFDEPTAGLDPYEISLPIATLKKLQSENKTVIVISHDMDFVAENISRVNIPG